MQGRHSLRGDLTPTNKNIHQIRRLKETMRRLAEENNLVPMEVEEETNQTSQAMAADGERQLVTKEYARPIIDTFLLLHTIG